MRGLHFIEVFNSARRVVGLEISARTIGAVQVHQGFKGPEIERTALRDVVKPAQLGIELKSFFRTEKLQPETLITALPSSVAFFRELHLPFQNPKKLRQVVKYQMEPLVPIAVEDMVSTFIPPKRGMPVTTIGVPKRALSDHLETLAGAGLEPHRVGLQDIALFSLFLGTEGGGMEGPVAVVRLNGNETAVQIIVNGRLIFIRSFPVWGNPLNGLSESFDLFALTIPKTPVQKIYVTGPLAADKALVLRIGEVTRVKSILWRPFDGVKHDLEGITEGLQASLSVPLGLALTACKGMLRGPYFRKEEFVVTTMRGIQRHLIILFSAFLLLLGLWTLQIFQNLYAEKRNNESLIGEIQRVFTETYPGAGHIVKGRELAQMQQLFAQEKAEYHWLDHVAAQGSVLEALLDLTKSLSGLPEVRVSHISMQEGTVHLDGATTSFHSVDTLKGRLAGSFRGLKLLGAKVDSQAGLVTFRFVMGKKDGD